MCTHRFRIQRHSFTGSVCPSSRPCTKYGALRVLAPGWAAVLALLWLPLLSLAAPGGTVEGTVSYTADPERPWRFARYYLEDAQRGRLAEALIALEGTKLSPPAEQHTTRTQTVDQVDYQFVPETTALRAGDAIRFTNSDYTLHNVMTADGRQPFNVSIGREEEFIQPFPDPGGLAKPYRIGCVFHGNMRAWVYVFDHPWFQITGADGRFRLENVPAGEYTLKLIHPAGRLQWSGPVKVLPGETVRREIVLSPDDLMGARSGTTPSP